MTFKILSIDGGGIRGIIPAMFLEEVEKRTQIPISDSFDLIAGTSTGGILALGFAIANQDGTPKFTASMGVQLYAKHGKDVFPPVKCSILSKLRNALCDKKYSSEGIKHILKEQFGDAKLDDIVPNVDVLIPSYDLDTRKPRFFKSSRVEDRTYHMWQIAMATAAAPTFFEPYYSTTESPITNELLVDGGVFANSPALCAYSEVVGTGETDILLVSVGTGYASEPYQQEDAKDWGQLEWILPLISVMFDGMGGATHFQLQQLLPEERYFRFQIKLPNEVATMDDSSPQHIEELKKYAEEMIDNAGIDGTLDAVCDLL